MLFLLFFIIVKKKFKKLNEVNMINFCENNKHIDLLGIKGYKLNKFRMTWPQQLMVVPTLLAAPPT